MHPCACVCTILHVMLSSAGVLEPPASHLMPPATGMKGSLSTAALKATGSTCGRMGRKCDMWGREASWGRRRVSSHQLNVPSPCESWLHDAYGPTCPLFSLAFLCRIYRGQWQQGMMHGCGVQLKRSEGGAYNALVSVHLPPLPLREASCPQPFSTRFVPAHPSLI